MDLNKTSLIGNLTSDPEARTMPSGQNLAIFRLATNYTWRDASTKEKRTRADFHRIVAWGRLADIINTYLKKGSKVFLDGGLFPKNKKLETLNLKPKTIVHGDVLIPVVSLASIVAKVTRDKRMRWIARKYPGYFFENNVGYGTKAHIRVLKKKGYSEIHRLTFIRRFVKMSG